MSVVLLAEDEDTLGQLIKEALEHEPDFSVEWVKDGEAALDSIETIVPDVCILDVMMPKLDGFKVAKRIRGVNENLPIIFLTARSQTEDVIKGFSSGGDDYLKKPFSIDELIVRVRALLKRSSGIIKTDEETSEKYVFGKYHFFPASQILRCPEAKYNLTSRESALLKELVIHKNSIVHRKEVLNQLWGDDNVFNSRTMDVYIAKLRKYLAHDTTLSIINVRGFGHKLAEDKFEI